jgi:hypothetical protein
VDVLRRKVLAIVKGDTSQPLGAIEMYWPFFLWRRRRQFGKDYAIRVYRQPTKADVLMHLSSADAAIFYGHGHPGVVHLGSDDFTTSDVAELAGKRSTDLDFVHIACCGTCASGDWVEAWLKLTPRLSGFRGQTYDIRTPFHIPSAAVFHRR